MCRVIRMADVYGAAADYSGQFYQPENWGGGEVDLLEESTGPGEPSTEDDRAVPSNHNAIVVVEETTVVAAVAYRRTVVTGAFKSGGRKRGQA